MFIYVSFGSEAETHKIIEHSLSLGKCVCVPKVINKAEGMKVLVIDSLSDMQRSNYGILEPLDDCNEVSIDKIDLALLPGIAFDISGKRLGYGGGFYDRYLENDSFRAAKIAIAYDCQVIDEVPFEKQDVLIDGIITETGFKNFKVV